jgi:hypothetical protein
MPFECNIRIILICYRNTVLRKYGIVHVSHS